MTWVQSTHRYFGRQFESIWKMKNSTCSLDGSCFACERKRVRKRGGRDVIRVNSHKLYFLLKFQFNFITAYYSIAVFFFWSCILFWPWRVVIGSSRHVETNIVNKIGNNWWTWIVHGNWQRQLGSPAVRQHENERGNAHTATINYNHFRRHHAPMQRQEVWALRAYANSRLPNDINKFNFINIKLHAWRWLVEIGLVYFFFGIMNWSRLHWHVRQTHPLLWHRAFLYKVQSRIEWCWSKIKSMLSNVSVVAKMNVTKFT